MKIKTDLYTKIMLTATVILLTAHLVKDIDFVTKAQASELDLSALKIEDASDAESTTFYIYENEKICGPFGSNEYITQKWESFSPSTRRKDENKAYINNEYDIPKYIITSKTGSFWLDK